MHDVGDLGLGIKQARTIGGVKTVKGITTLPS